MKFRRNIDPSKFNLVEEVLRAMDAIQSGAVSASILEQLGSAAAFLKTSQSWEDDREKVYGCKYQGQNYVAVYDKGVEILHMTRNLTMMRDNAYLVGIEKRLPQENLIVHFPPDAKPFSMGRVTQIEYIG